MLTVIYRNSPLRPASLAWLELRTVLASIIRRYEFTVLPGQNLEPRMYGTLNPHQEALHATVKLRDA